MKGKTLAAIVLSAALGLGISGCYDAKASDARQNEAQQYDSQARQTQP